MAGDFVEKHELLKEFLNIIISFFSIIEIYLNNYNKVPAKNKNCY
jgi:hypothetical protein